MKANLYEVVVQQHRNDWIADYFYDHVHRYLTMMNVGRMKKEDAYSLLQQVAESAQKEGWSIKWIKRSGQREGIWLNNGGVAVRIRKCKSGGTHERRSKRTSTEVSAYPHMEKPLVAFLDHKA